MSVAAILAFLGGMKAWPWRLIGVIVGILVVGAAAYFFISAVYNRGVSDENARWQTRIHQAEQRASRAEAQLAQDIAHRSEQAQIRTVERVRYVTEARQEIADATTTEARLAAYHAVRNRLRNDAAAHLSRASSDYLSTIPT